MIFSVKKSNEKTHRVITIFGIKIKFKKRFYAIASKEIKKELGLKTIKMLHPEKNKFYIKQYICKDACNKKYIVAFSHSALSKKKILASINKNMLDGIKNTYGKYFQFNRPKKSGTTNKGNVYAVYDYFDDLIIYNNEQHLEEAINIAKSVYEKSRDYIINEQNIDDFTHAIFMNLVSLKITKEKLEKDKLYQKFKNELLKTKVIKIAPQHCDYNLCNIMVNNIGEKYLMDLERSSLIHFASYDWYHIKRCVNGWYNNLNENIPYCNLLNLYVCIIDKICRKKYFPNYPFLF